MATIIDQIRTIIEDFKELQPVPAHLRGKDDDFPLPRMIGAGDGGSIVVSRKIDDAIAAVADQWRDGDPSPDWNLAAKVTRAEWTGSVRKAFGPALATIDLDRPSDENAEAVLEHVKTVLNEQVNSYRRLEFAFGCTLFDAGAIKPFSIGPVSFECRSDWLARKSDDAVISAATRRRVERAWLGKRLANRKPSTDSKCETGILNAIGECRFVCSVTTTGLAQEAARNRALTAARLAIAAVALLWKTPSQVLKGMNLVYDSPGHLQQWLTFVPGEKIAFASLRWSHQPHGPSLQDAEWDKLFDEYKDHFRVVGEILDYFLHPTGKVARPTGKVRPKMMNRLAQALIWFHEASRESVTLIAIVKYAAALDALACGKGHGGICRLINARLGIQNDKTILKNGLTLEQAVDEIYRYGRSRTIHGTNEKLGHDWSVTKGLAEQFARGCLVKSIEWAAQNSTSDDPEQLAPKASVQAPSRNSPPLMSR